jgi:hypothetical protein
MIDFDQREQQLLSRARRALSPTRTDEQRVLSQLLPALALSASVLPAVAAQKPLSVTVSRSILGVLALGVAGFLGYGWGYQAGLSARVASVVATPAPKAVASVPAAASSEPLRLPLESESRPPAREVSSVAAHHADVRIAPIASTDAPAVGLDEEVRQLRRVERALRDGNPRLALVIAEELDQSIPGGQLLPERRAASLMAGCQLGADHAVDAALSFIAKNPTSAYGSRLKEVCHLSGTQRNTAASGTEQVRKGGSP